MTEKTYNIVGVSTQGKITKFRVANGDMASRIKVLERNGHSDISFIELESPLGKMEAIAAYKARFPESESIRMPNEGNDKPKKDGAKTVNISKKKVNVADAASELLREVAGEKEGESA